MYAKIEIRICGGKIVKVCIGPFPSTRHRKRFIDYWQEAIAEIADIKPYLRFVLLERAAKDCETIRPEEFGGLIVSYE